MAAYIIARINVTDPAQYENYKTLASAAIAHHGGDYLARGGATETLEGRSDERRIVILRFDDMDQARGFYNSPEYRQAIAARSNAATGEFLLVEGL